MFVPRCVKHFCQFVDFSLVAANLHVSKAAKAGGISCVKIIHVYIYSLHIFEI